MRHSATSQVGRSCENFRLPHFPFHVVTAMRPLALEIGARASALNMDEMPGAAIDWAKLAIADNCAAALAGAREDAAELLFETLSMGQAGGCHLLGRPERLPALDAALLNGVAAHVLDFDDCSVTMDGHPSVPMVSALLALADVEDRSGNAVLEAYIVGFETETRIAQALNPDLVDRGWHPTSVLGVFGAAAACARLLKLPAPAFATALAIAASHAAGLRANSGTMTKPLHAGQANRNGLLAALLARRGFSANLAIFEHDLGFSRAFAGRSEDIADRLLSGWGEDFNILSPGLAIKQYPCCAFVHPAIAASEDAFRRTGLSPAHIAAVRVQLHRSRIRNVNRPDPRNGLDAKFSTHYVVALALLGQHIAFGDFQGDAFFRPDVRALMARTVLEPHDDDPAEGRVIITLGTGDVITARASVDMGRGPDNPMSPEEFGSKFVSCAGIAVGDEAAGALLLELMALERAPSVRALLERVDRAERLHHADKARANPKS